MGRLTWYDQTLFCLAFLSPSASAMSEGRPAASHDLGREHWAYPLGAIVTQDGGKLLIPEEDASSDGAAPVSPAGKGVAIPPSSRPAAAHSDAKLVTSDISKTLEGAAQIAEKNLLQCAADLRARSADLVLASPTITLTLMMPIAAHGVVATVDYEGRPLPSYFIECTSKTMAFLKGTSFPPRLDQRTITAKVIFETRFLTDEEAQGRGYQFFAAEEKWEKTYKSHPEWSRCKTDRDCVTSNERCEIRSINAQHLAAYVAAMQARQKRYCPNPPDTALYPSACRAHTCTARKTSKKSR